jgi:hypothetical protein
MAMTRTNPPAVADNKTVVEEPQPEVVEQKMLKFRKKPTGGSFRMRNGKIVKPNQVFEAFPEDIPKAFRDQIECLEPRIEDRPLEIVETEFSIAAADEEGTFNVLNSYGKPINESTLSRAEAEGLIAELEK